MLRDFLREGGLYTFSSLVTKGISLLLIPFYTAYFATSDYGIIDILVVFGAFLNVVISLQLNQGLGRFVAEPSFEESEKKSLASTIIWFVAGVYAFFTLLLVFVPDPVIKMLSTDEIQIPRETFVLSIAAIGINGLFYFMQVYLRFLRRAKEVAVIAFLHATLNILLTLYLVLGLDLGINGIYWASILVTPLILSIQFYQLRKDIVFKFENKYLRKVFIFSYPLIPASLAYMILDFTDRIYIKEFLSFSDLGIYGIGQKFASIISIIVVGFSAALAPIIYQKHRDQDTLDQLGRMFRLFIAIGTMGVLTLSFFSYEFLVIFTQEAYYPAQTVMPILYTSLLITGLGMFSPGLHIKEKTKMIALIVIIAACTNIVLNYFLISEFLLIGAALGTIVSVFINNFALFTSSQKHYPFPIHIPKVLGVSVLFGVCLYVGCYVLPTIDSFESGTVANIAVKVAILGGYGFIILALKMVSFKSLKKLRK